MGLLFGTMSLAALIGQVSVSIPAGQEQILETVDVSTIGDKAIELDRVELGQEAVLQLPPFESVLIKDLVARDGARIRLANQLSGADAKASGDGGDGANARIFIYRLDGHVLIEAKGGDGGDGRDGRDGRQGRDGKKGRDARTLFFGWITIGNGDDGHPGEPGEPGEDGAPGGDGGDGGNVRVYYQQRVDSAQVLVNVDAGKGGVGGLGGSGGLGGNGGAPGKGIRPGKPGPMGKPGRHGRPGRPGKPGHPGTASIYQVDESLFRCLVKLDLLEDAEPEWIEECRS